MSQTQGASSETGIPARENWRRPFAPGLIVGSIALATAWFELPALVNVPLAGLALNVALAWGAYTVLAIGIHLRPASHTAWVPAIAPWLGAPMLLRMHLASSEQSLPSWIATTWTLEALAVSLAVAVVLAYGHLLDDLATTKAALISASVMGFGLDVVLLLVHISMPSLAEPGALTIFALAVLAVIGAVLVQYFVLRRSTKPGFAALAGGAAVAVTTAQLLDGFVTYLAVVDPFNLLARDMSEQMPVSAFLLEHTGIGYPIVKWGLAITLAFMLERAWATTSESSVKRTGTYLALIFVGLGPALYSTASLLA